VDELGKDITQLLTELDYVSLRELDNSVEAPDGVEVFLLVKELA
jgi:hypothetical protein